MDGRWMVVMVSCLMAMSCVDGKERWEDNVASDEAALSYHLNSKNEGHGTRRRYDHRRCGDHRGHGHQHCEKVDAAAEASGDMRVDIASDASSDSQPADVPAADTGAMDAGTADVDATQVDAVPDVQSCGLANQPCCIHGLAFDCSALGSLTCDGTFLCVPCGQIGRPCCKLFQRGSLFTACAGDESGIGTTGPFSVCDVPVDPLADPQCVSCGGPGRPCCRFNHGSSWLGGCTGSGGRNSCQAGLCAGCGGEGQPCCPAPPPDECINLTLVCSRIDGHCNPCGLEGQPCCRSATPCMGGTGCALIDGQPLCAQCGGPGQPSCL